MNIRRFIRLCGLLVVLSLFAPRYAEAIQIELPGSTAQLVVDSGLGSYEGLALDAAGNLYTTLGNSGFLQVTPGGTATPWSSTNGYKFVFAPDGTGYAIGAWPCKCIEKFSPDGLASVLQADTLAWGSLAVLPDGSLYASVPYDPGAGIYRIDRATGQAMVIVAGGPGPGGSGLFGGMAVGSDGNLYVNASLDGTLAGRRLFRLDGSTLTPLATPANGAEVIALGPAGRFLAISGVPGSLYQASDLWLFDPVSGVSNWVARTDIYFHEWDVMFRGTAYDANREIVYVTENHRIWALHLDLSTPARTESWGAVKALYRE